MLDFRARANTFGMSVGDANWNEMKSITEDYEAFFSERMEIIEGYRKQLTEEELTQTEIEAILDVVYQEPRAIDSRYVNDYIEHKNQIPDELYEACSAWVDEEFGTTPDGPGGPGGP